MAQENRQAKPSNFTEALSDEDQQQFMALQRAVFDATKAAIARNAPGLPVAVVKSHIEQMGGSLVDVREMLPADVRPFRCRVRTEEGRVKEIVGWG